LNEVRLLANSILYHKAIFTMDKTIKYDQVKSVLKTKPGDKIVTDLKGFTQIAKTFFAEMEKKYV